MLYVAPLALNFLPEHVVADIVADLGTLCAAITNIFLDSDEGASFLVAVENCVEIKIFKIRSTSSNSNGYANETYPNFEISTRGEQSSKNQPNRLRFDRARDF